MDGATLVFLGKFIWPAFFAFLLTIAGCFFALTFFPRWGLMDRPKKYGLKRQPIPYYGGLVIFSVLVLSILLFVKMDIHVLGFLLGGLVITGVSFLDDRFGLSPYLRLGVQMVVALLLVLFGIGIGHFANPFGGQLDLNIMTWQITLGQTVVVISLLGALFTVIWLVAMMNTMNFLDGLNGLPSGVTVIASFTLFLLSIRPDIHYDISSQEPVAMISILLFAVTLAFWFFDFHPAKMLMGDTGSMFLGYVLATLAIFSGGKVATAFLVLGLPFLDAAWVIIRRILEGKSPFKGDLFHLHHRFLYAGVSERKAMFFIYACCALFGAIAIYFQGFGKLFAIVGLVGLMFIIGTLLVKNARK